MALCAKPIAREHFEVIEQDEARQPRYPLRCVDSHPNPIVAHDNAASSHPKLRDLGKAAYAVVT